MYHLTFLTWTVVTESDSGLETILNYNDIKKASWFNHIISFDRQYKVRDYVKNETFTLLKMNWGNWMWLRL